jgi:hypothetical protein
LFSLNSVLGTSIEVQVVHTLNKMRNIWDPDEDWAGYRFERQSQTFPDVRLVRRGAGDPDIAMGIELKGWYLLSKEGVPSLRFQVTPAACSPFDLIAVVPWHLSYVLSGTPVARYSIVHDGALTLLGSTPVRATDGVGAVDARLSPYGAYLYLDQSATGKVGAFAVNGGNLTELGTSPFPLPPAPHPQASSSISSLVKQTRAAGRPRLRHGCRVLHVNP